MLIRLVKSEWQRFIFNDKILISSFLLFSFNFIIAFYYSNKINLVDKNLSIYPSFLTFPILFLSEIQSTLFNFIIIVFTGYFFFKEYEYGYTKFIFLRPVKKNNFYTSKLIIFYLFLLYIYFVFFVSSYISGFLILEKVDKVKFFLIANEYGFLYWIKKTILFYIICFFSTIYFSSFLIFLNYFIKNSFYSVVFTLLYLFLNIIYPYLKNTFLYLIGIRNENVFKFFEYLSVTQIQQDGIIYFINSGDKIVIVYLFLLTIPVFFISSKLYLKMIGG